MIAEGSVGIALYPAHGTDAATLLRCADVATYAAKRGWRSCPLRHDARTRPTGRLTPIGPPDEPARTTRGSRPIGSWVTRGRAHGDRQQEQHYGGYMPHPYH